MSHNNKKKRPTPSQLVKKLLVINNHGKVLENFSKYIAGRSAIYSFAFLVIILMPSYLIHKYMKLMNNSSLSYPPGIGAGHLFDWDIIVFLFISIALTASYVLVSIKNVARMDIAEDRVTMLIFEGFLWPGNGFRSILIWPKLGRLAAMSFMVALMSYIAARMTIPVAGIGEIELGWVLALVYIILLHGIAGVELFSDGIIQRIKQYVLTLVGAAWTIYVLIIGAAFYTFFYIDTHVLGLGESILYVVITTGFVMLFSLAVYYHYWLMFTKDVETVEKDLEEHIRIKFSIRKDKEKKTNENTKDTAKSGAGEEIIYDGPLMSYLEKRIKMSYLINIEREKGRNPADILDKKYRLLIVLLMSYIVKKFYQTLNDRYKRLLSGKRNNESRGKNETCMVVMLYRVLNELGQLNVSFTGKEHINLLEECFSDPTMTISPTYAYGRMPSELLRWGDTVDALVTLYGFSQGEKKKKD